jgi:SPOR domain
VSEHDDDRELYEEVAPRSIFAATWFRVLLVLIVIGVVGAVASSYVLDFMNPPPSRPTTAAKPPSPPVAIPAPPAATSALAEKPAVDKVDSPAVPPPTGPIETKPVPARPTEAKPVAPKPDAKIAAPADKTKSAMAVIEPTPPPKPAAPTAKPASKPAATPKTDTAAKDTADAAAKDTAANDPTKTDGMAKPDAKPEMVAKADPKPAIATKPAATPKRAAAVATTPAPKPATASGPFWVQVGAFKDADTAKRLAAKLRGDNFNVEESVTKARAAATSTPKTAAPAPKTTDAATEQYDVFVSGLTPEELNSKLAAKGLAAEASGGGMVVKPSLPLRDAVALSKDLAVEGFKVQVRRAGSSMSAAATPTVPAGSAPATSAGGSELHRVRVGAFTDRAAAQEAMRQLEAKGYKPYIARGDQ